MCHQLLDQADVEAAIRVGDVYALMVEWFYSQRQMEEGPAACNLGAHKRPEGLARAGEGELHVGDEQHHRRQRERLRAVGRRQVGNPQRAASLARRLTAGTVSSLQCTYGRHMVHRSSRVGQNYDKNSHALSCMYCVT